MFLTLASILSLVTIGELLEGGMLVCFGISWPVDIIRTIRTGRTEGKSLAFMSLVLAGYVLGMGAKLARVAGTGQWPELITLLYVFNSAAIIVDIVITLRLRPLPGRAWTSTK
jgi:hypothetical protein